MTIWIVVVVGGMLSISFLLLIRLRFRQYKNRNMWVAGKMLLKEQFLVLTPQ